MSNRESRIEEWLLGGISDFELRIVELGRSRTGTFELWNRTKKQESEHMQQSRTHDPKTNV